LFNFYLIFLLALSEPSGFIGCYFDRIGGTITDALTPTEMKRDANVLECINYCEKVHYRYAGAKVIL
jgi:hypothetical protein